MTQVRTCIRILAISFSARRAPLYRFAQKGRLFSFTPGFSRVVGSQENRKPFKRFPVLALAQFTWLKPGVNKIEGPKGFDNLRFRTTFCAKHRKARPWYSIHDFTIPDLLT